MFEGTGGASVELVDILNSRTEGSHRLILGTPGAGKSVAAYLLAAKAAEGEANQAFVFRFSDIRYLSESQIGFSRNLERSSKVARPHVIIDGLDEASVGNELDAKTLSRLLQDLAANFDLTITCRSSDFEARLASYIGGITFSKIYYMKGWAVETHFRRFVENLVEGGFLSNDEILKIVLQTPSLAMLVERPLFARMLCLINPTDASGVITPSDLYSRFFKTLDVRANSILAGVGCHIEHSSYDIWRRAAWNCYSLGILQDESLGLESLLATLSDMADDAGCLERSLDSILDRGSVIQKSHSTFVHYSFYEFLLASYIYNHICDLKSDQDRLKGILMKDLPRQVRHFLTDLLKQAAGPETSAKLASLFSYVRKTTEVAECREGCNLIAYLISRSSNNVELLKGSISHEDDLFIKNSLFWGLSHMGDVQSTVDFLHSLSKNQEHLEMCRGYLLYYHGDLSLKDRPPFLDQSPFIPWDRTKSAVNRIIAGDSYRKDVPATRRLVDIATFLSFCSVRKEKIGGSLVELLDNRLKEISDDEPQLAKLSNTFRSLARTFDEEQGSLL